ncbi:hypothetical protein M413DRAFT_14929 [Hebeloma cylindrosporum]|uniref:Uncharacterized protein n=1 Tax=Hebeloma cylindrosporum TaxID=76867 RepID=A0A0C2Y0W1_HEBCY|nr:hypothetical protein M413DRAFT_14929 [Hebeloma cylindrosporum h7]
MPQRRRQSLPMPPDHSSWLSIDLLEFIRLAFMALLWFMTLEGAMKIDGMEPIVQHRFNTVVWVADSAGILPPWIHDFRQWHTDMFATLNEDLHAEIFCGGDWIVHPYGDFQLSVEPLRVPVPPDQLSHLAKFSTSLQGPPPVVTRPETPEAELSFPERRAKRLRTLDFGTMPNQGVGRITRQDDRHRARDVLLAVRQERHRQASPDTRAGPLPKLLSVKELRDLRVKVPSPTHACRNCFLSGHSLDCTYKSWGMKCNTCMHLKHDLHLLLDCINEACNLGNMNSALATIHFNQHNWLADEFITRLFRLAGEDSTKVLEHVLFNEDRVITLLDEILDKIPGFDPDLVPPSRLDEYFHHLVNAIKKVKVEDHTAQLLVQQLHQEHQDLPSRDLPPVRSPLTYITLDNADDIYADAVDDEQRSPSACATDSTPEVIDLVDSDDDLIDDEVEEVPPGQESSGASGSGSLSSGSSKDDDEGLDFSTHPALIWRAAFIFHIMLSPVIILDNPELTARLAGLKTEQQDFLSLVACSLLSEVFDKIGPDSASVFVPLAIAAIDYCHRFRTYFYAYHCPSFYHWLVPMARQWLGLEDDGKWQEHIAQTIACEKAEPIFTQDINYVIPIQRLMTSIAGWIRVPVSM